MWVVKFARLDITVTQIAHFSSSAESIWNSVLLVWLDLSKDEHLLRGAAMLLIKYSLWLSLSNHHWAHHRIVPIAFLSVMGSLKIYKTIYCPEITKQNVDQKPKWKTNQQVFEAKFWRNEATFHGEMPQWQSESFSIGNMQCLDKWNTKWKI